MQSQSIGEVWWFKYFRIVWNYLMPIPMVKDKLEIVDHVINLQHMKKLNKKVSYQIKN